MNTPENTDPNPAPKAPEKAPPSVPENSNLPTPAPSARPPKPGEMEISPAFGNLKTLSEADQIEYMACEEVIASGWATFVQVGLALATIPYKDWYKLEFDTFDDYYRKRWAYGRHYVNRLISAAQVFTFLVTNCHQQPERESQIRPLI